MVSKERLENVLHCYLTDNNVQYISEYYRTFFENPESYENDHLTDIIIDDLGLTKVEPWATDVNVWEALENSTMLDLKHVSVDSSLAWGHINHVPLYVRRVEGTLTQKFVNMNADFSYDLLKSVASEAPEYGTIARVIMSPKGQVVVYCIEEQYVDKLAEVSKWAPDGWSHMGDFVMGAQDDATPLCFVPFYEMSNGSRLPVMWIDTINTYDDSECSLCLNEFLQLDRYDEDTCKQIYARLKESLEPVDLDIAPDNRYKKVWAKHYCIVYNRNHTAYNGNIKNAYAVAPFLLSMLPSFMQLGDFKSNLYELISGKEKNWEDIFLTNSKINDEVPWSIDVKDTGKIVAPAAGPDGVLPKGPIIGVVGHGRRPTAFGSTINKLLQVASNDYESEDSIVYAEAPMLDKLQKWEIDWIDAIFRQFENIFFIGGTPETSNPVDILNAIVSKVSIDAEHTEDTLMSFIKEYQNAFTRSKMIKVNGRDLTTITKIICDLREEKV